MIQALAWLTSAGCGTWSRDQQREKQCAWVENCDATISRCFPQGVKNAARMAPATRRSLAAAALALEASGWKDQREGDIGLLTAGEADCLQAGESYFEDYVANGRTLGRGNLFIYTLPTSNLSEIAIALRLRGPIWHWHEKGRPVGGMMDQAGRWLNEKEATGVLALWSDGEAAVCLAIGTDDGDEVEAEIKVNWECLPRALAEALAHGMERKLQP